MTSRPRPTETSGTRPSNRGHAFDGDGLLWFTGQSGIYGRLDPATGDMKIFPAPEGRGPYGITATPNGDVYFVSLRQLSGKHRPQER